MEQKEEEEKIPTTQQQPTPHPSKQFPFSSVIFVFLEHHSEDLSFLILFLLFLHKGKTNHIPVKGEIPALPDVVFPAFPPSLQSLPSFDRFSTHTPTNPPSPPLPFSSSLCGTEVFIKKRRAMNAHLILL